jgi:hypothetical protein
MIPASRTPEGEPLRCPLCGSSVCMEVSITSKDATCPNCGTLLWQDVGRRYPSKWTTRLIPWMLVALAVAAIASFAVLLAFEFALWGLGAPETLVLLTVSVLLFCRKIREVFRYLGNIIGSRFS